MIKRSRDKLRSYRPQEVVSEEDWKDIEDRYYRASTFMEESNPAYQILVHELREAEEIVMTNRVHEVKEVRIIGEIQKIFTTPKQEQLDQLVGQILFIRGYLAELQVWIDRKNQLEKLEADGRVTIRRPKQNE